MANTLTPYNPEYWSNMIAALLTKRTIFRNICSFREETLLRNGDVVHRPYRTALTAGPYTKATEVTATDAASTDESLTVNKHNVIRLYFDDLDVTQMKQAMQIVNEYIKDAVRALREREDGFALFEVTNAVDSVDDADINPGGTDGNNFTLTEDNVDKVYRKAMQKLDENNVDSDNRFSVISPATYSELLGLLASKQTALGDKTSQYNHKGKYFDFDIYVSNNLTFSGVFTPTDNPSNAETITIDGVTCKVVATLSGTASATPEFHICSTTAKTITNMVTAINTPGTAIAEATDTGYQLPTTASLNKMHRWYAEDGTTYIKIYVKGGGDVTCSASSTDVGAWSQETAHHVFGRKGAIDMVVQKKPNVKMQDSTSNGLLGKTAMIWDLFGIKTFNKGTYELIEVLIAT